MIARDTATFGGELRASGEPRAGFTDIPRAEILAEDIRDCMLRHGRIEIQTLLAIGWRLEDLEGAAHAETRAAAAAHRRTVDRVEHASVALACIGFLASTSFVALAMLRDLTIPGV